MNFKQILIISTLACSLLADKATAADFPGKLVDDVLLEHFNHLTKYDHSFDGLPMGDCGTLFDMAVQLYNENMEDKFHMLTVNNMLKETSFDASKCQHTKDAYSWVLLHAEIPEHNQICEVHVPIDTRNIDFKDRERYPLYVDKHATLAIKNKQSWCYTVNKETNKKTEFVLAPRLVEPVVEYQTYTLTNETEYTVPQNKFNQVQAKKLLAQPTEGTATFEEESDLEKSVKDNSDSWEDIEEEEEETAPVRNHKRRNGVLVTLDECTEEDKMRVIELYDAEIVKDKAAGFVVYTENIINCKASHGKVHTYVAEIKLNEHTCEFNVMNDTEKAGLAFLPNDDKTIVSCKDFKGLP